MVRLESHARKKDYPGIQMHAALMRAEFLAKQGRKEEAQEVLQDALDILDSPSVKTLRKKIKKMIDELCVA
jgi:predicted RNA polymerase sigma factor